MSIIDYAAIFAVAMILCLIAGFAIAKCIDKINLVDQPASKKQLQRRTYDEERAKRDMEDALAAANADVDWRKHNV